MQLEMILKRLLPIVCRNDQEFWNSGDKVLSELFATSVCFVFYIY